MYEWISGIKYIFSILNIPKSVQMEKNKNRDKQREERHEIYI